MLSFSVYGARMRIYDYAKVLKAFPSLSEWNLKIDLNIQHTDEILSLSLYLSAFSSSLSILQTILWLLWFYIFYHSVILLDVIALQISKVKYIVKMMLL